MRINFSRILFLSISVLLIALITAGGLATRALITDTVTESAETSIRSTGDAFLQQLGARASEMADSVHVLVNDFGFLEAERAIGIVKTGMERYLATAPSMKEKRFCERGDGEMISRSKFWFFMTLRIFSQMNI